MKNRFWRKALAAALALLIVSGSTPIQPLSQVFEDIAITASAETVTSTMFGTLGESGYYTLSSQTYTLTDDVNTASYIYVPAGVTATIDLAGYTIDRGLTSEMTNGSVIIVEGTLTITDSSTGGTVQGGYDAGDGYGYSTSCVKVLEGATFNLQGGTLIGRVQDYDYTVSVVDNSNFTMTGGKITGGWTGVLAVGNVTLTGGEISGNNIGVRVGENFSISGNPVITGNTVMNADLRSSGGGKINITGALTDGANIGITAPTPTDNAPVTVTSGYGTYNSEPVSTYFSLDNDGQIQTSPFDYMTVVMGWNEDRTEIAVGTATRTVTFDMNGHGDVINAVSLLSGYKVAEPTATTADGWYFVSWFTDDACTTGNEWNFDNAVTSNMTLHALWTQEAFYSIILPENMVIVSTTNALVGGKYPVGTEIKFKLSSEDYVVDGDVKNGDNVLTTDGDGNYTVTMGDADITITATVKKAVEPNKTLSGSENYEANDGDVLTGSTSGTVTIASGAKITLSDVTITGGIVCEGTAEITLVGTNSVSGAIYKAGIQVGGSGTTLTIKGNGSLTANGGIQSAGIGLSRAWEVDAMGGDIVIEGGNITATGDRYGAGIGTGVSYGKSSDKTATIGNITIKGGSVRAIGGTDQSCPGSGIGKGSAFSYGHAVVGTITIYDDIDMVDASSISESIVYMHETTDVTESKADYFTIGEDGNRRLIVQKPVIADIPDQTYTGSEITPEPQVTIGSLSLTKGSDYVYSYSDNTNAGTAKVTVTFKGDYASLGSVEKEFTIAKATANVTAPSAVDNLVFNGNEQELVTEGSTDFGTVLYSLDGETYSEEVPKGTNAGKYTVYYKVDTDNYYYAPKKVEVTIAESYTITWKNGDEILETDNYVPGGATPEYNGETPTKPMDDDYTYTFSGWSPEISSVEGDIIYTAQFTATARTDKCGDKAYWEFDSKTRKLTISGTGAMYDYKYNTRPWYKYKDNITSVIIGDGITSIGNYAFEGCENLTSITIPDGITSIGNYAFEGCESLTSITIPDGVTSIGDSAFFYCTSLTSVEIPDSVKSIGANAFYGCQNLESVVIGSGVTSIGNYAFQHCESLASVEIPDSVESIGENAFQYCASLTSVEIPDSVTSLSGNAFYECKNLESVVIGNGVTSIGNNAFYDCTSLESIEIPNSVTSIGDYAFYNCTGLTSITIPDSVESIGKDAFYNCTNIKDVYCYADPKNLTWYEGTCNDFMLPQLSRTTVCHVPEEYLDTYNSEKFSDVNVTFKSIKPTGKCGDNATWSLDDAGKLTISGTGTIYNYYNGDQPWYHYKDIITSVKIENGITSIGKYAFCNFISLTSIEIPNSVTSMGDDAFLNCKSLASITIPKNVTSIGRDAFFMCTNITDVYCYANPDTLTWGGKSCDDFMPPQNSRTTVCHVPAEYLETYEAKFGAGSETPVNVTFVGDVDMGLGEHLYGHSITLDGGIGVNFYVELTDELLASETAEMIFTVPNGSKTDTQALLVKDVIANDKNKVSIGSKTYYKFKCSISAKDMASTITAQLVDGEKSGTEHTYSVKDYAEYILEHNEVEEYANAAPLVKAMLNYGAASQTYFGIEGTAANAELDDADKALGEVSIPDTFKFDEANAGLPEGVTFEGATLSLKSETTLSLYFKGLADGTKFTCDGKTVETVKNGEYVVARIRGINASELENDFTVTFEGDSVTYKVTYNVMTYCYNVLNDGTVDDNLKNVCKALYNYAQAAKTYSE